MSVSKSKVKLTRDKKRHFRPLISAASVQFMFGKASSASSLLIYCSAVQDSRRLSTIHFTRARRDNETRHFRRVGVGGVNEALEVVRSRVDVSTFV